MNARSGSLAHVLPSALAALGVPSEVDYLELGSRLGEMRRIAVLLVDGLGYHLLPEAAPVAPTLADALAGRVGHLDELCCAFPSTTPTNLVTLGTGVLPGRHGVLGFTVNVPGSDRLLTHIDWREDPPPSEWQPVPPVFARAEAAGLRAVVVSRPEYLGSGLTDAAYRGARYVGATDSDELAERMLAELRSAPGLVQGYYPALDTAAHSHGVASPQWRSEAATVDRMLTRIIEGLPGDAALLVTADHGALDVPLDGRYDFATDERLRAGVRLIAGEPRVRYLHVRPGATADVIATWRAVLGTAATVLSRDESVARGWFGPVTPSHLGRIGDVVVLCHDTAVVLATGHEPAAVARLVGFHGALTAAETAIPLICFRGR